MIQARHLIHRLPLELIFWTTGLLALAVFPISYDSHFTLCPIALAGIEWCPGCGLGRAIALAFHGEFHESWQTHPLGFFAIGVLTFRIISLTLNKPPTWQRSSKFFRK